MITFILIVSLLGTSTLSAASSVDVDAQDVHVSINNDGTNQESSNNDSCTTINNNYIFNVFSGCCNKTTGEGETEPEPTGPIGIDLSKFWLMSATGLSSNFTAVKVSSLNPDVNPVPNCHRYPEQYPLPIHEGMGGTLFPEGKPIICGGDLSAGGTNVLTEKCFTFDGQNWNQAMSMPTTLAEAGFTTHPDWGFIMAGGEVTDDTDENTKLVIKTENGNSVQFLPELPEPISHTCLVALDEKRLFLGGGRNEDTSISRKAYIYDKESQIWDPILDMPNPQHGQFCGVVRDDGEPKLVVLSGGMAYNFDSKTWSIDPELESPASSANSNFNSVVPYGHTFLLAGTVTGEVFKFNRDGPAGSKWIQMPEKSLIGEPDWGKITMLVDSRLFDECA